MRDNCAYIGIDPGKAGFLTVLIKGLEPKFFAMPTHKVESGKKTKSGKAAMKSVFHEAGLVDIIRDIHSKSIGSARFGIIEDVTGRHGWSAQNNFNFGHTTGLQTMILHLLGAEVLKVKPQKWQAQMFAGYEKVMVPSSSGKTMVHDTKATALSVVMNENSNIDWRKSERAREPDDNKIDSFLMAKYLVKYLKH